MIRYYALRAAVGLMLFVIALYLLALIVGGVWSITLLRHRVMRVARPRPALNRDEMWSSQLQRASGFYLAIEALLCDDPPVYAPQ